MIKSDKPELPTNDRPPLPEGIISCRGYLDRQSQIVGPEIIVALGGVAAKSLTQQSSATITSLRGRWLEMPADLFAGSGSSKIKLLATYHPSALLYNPSWKRETWKDMQLVMKELGI